jgi:hypothetical protein
MTGAGRTGRRETRVATDPEKERDPDSVYVVIFLLMIAAVVVALWATGQTR